MAKAIRESDIVSNTLPEAFTKDRVYIYCPGCYDYHKKKYPDDEAYWMNGALHCLNITIHTFNGNYLAPTFSPSLLSRSTDYVCHSYVTDGYIRFLEDCTHDFKGLTLPLLECPNPTLEG